jgi:uncharacterized protein YeaO (DUF488 family)
MNNQTQKGNTMSKLIIDTLYAGCKKPAYKIANNVIVFSDREREPLQERMADRYKAIVAEINYLMKHYGFDYIAIAHSYSDQQYTRDTEYNTSNGFNIRIRYSDRSWHRNKDHADTENMLVNYINDALYEKANHRRAKLAHQAQRTFDSFRNRFRNELYEELDKQLDKMLKPYQKTLTKRQRKIADVLPEKTKLKTHDLMTDPTYRFTLGLPTRKDDDETEE